MGQQRKEREQVETREKKLNEYETHELVEELTKREGITAQWAEPHEDKKFSISGPALVLIVID